MADVNQVLNFLMEELRADALRPDKDPFKMSPYMREHLIKEVIAIQKKRLQISGESKQLHAERERRNEVRPIGRPRKDLYPDTESKQFMRELDQQTKETKDGES